MIATIDELFLLSDRSDHSDGSDHMETRLNKIIISNLVLTTNVQQFLFSLKSYAYIVN